ncbi:MAG: flavin reductase family protein [Defluviitaleaceae bacterium]|nr:flavin reductase family protein [Defluviitaleaceae bacterium]
MMKRVDSGEWYATHIQPAFLIGTYNEDGTPNFAPITWVSSSYDGEHPLMTVSMNGTKKTKDNIARTKLLSANVVSTDMLALLDYFGMTTGLDGTKDALPYEWEDGHVLRVPTLNASRRVFELEVAGTYETSDTTTYFCRTRNCQQIEGMDGTHEDMARLEPLVYSGRYYKLGGYLGEMCTFYQKEGAE